MINKNIGCDVTNCTHHAGIEKYCTLSSIKITHNTVSNAISEKCTDCSNFELQSGYCQETT